MFKLHTKAVLCRKTLNDIVISIFFLGLLVVVWREFERLRNPVDLTIIAVKFVEFYRLGVVHVDKLEDSTNFLSAEGIV